MYLKMDLNPDVNLASICGANNIGKTNVLRAIDLFFNPEKFSYETDIPFQKLETGSGGNKYPEISIEFSDGKQIVCITRKLKSDIDEEHQLSGSKKDLKDRSRTEMGDKECVEFLRGFLCKFIEVINLSFPDLIREIVNEIYDVEYEKVRFNGLKETLRKAHADYSEGLLKVLKVLSDEISPSFKEFNDQWSVAFDSKSDVQKFRDLISDDVEFYIKDSSNKNISNKGSGLQRLAFILLQARISHKAKNKIPILLIDEPDAFLHQELQKKLNIFLTETFKKSGQVFLTTHSSVFIDTFHLRNVFLFELKVGEPFFYKKVNKEISKSETVLVDIDSVDGAKKIKFELGIENNDLDLLDPYNIIVEGEADEKYLTKLASYFEVRLPRVVVAHGVSNVEKLLEYYSNFYKSAINKKPKVLVLVDDDHAGRTEYRKIYTDIKKYGNLEIKLRTVPNFQGETSTHESIIENKQNSKKNEIEDLIYPEYLCSLVNVILKKKSFNEIDENAIAAKITRASFKSQGILFLIENEKNDANPDDGQTIAFSGSERVPEKMKSSLANIMNIGGDKRTLRLFKDFDEKYPHVRIFITKLSKESTT